MADFEQSIQSPHTSPKFETSSGQWNPHLQPPRRTLRQAINLWLSTHISLPLHPPTLRQILQKCHLWLRHRILLREHSSFHLSPPTDGAAHDTASFFAALANTSDSTLLSTIAIQQRLAQDVSSSSTFVLPPLVPPRLPHRVEQQLRNLQTLYQTVQDNEGQSSGSSPPDESKDMNREDKTLQQPLAEFTLFPNLPVELRLKIWYHTLPGPRLSRGILLRDEPRPRGARNPTRCASSLCGVATRGLEVIRASFWHR